MIYQIRAEGIRDTNELEKRLRLLKNFRLISFGRETVFNSFHSIVFESHKSVAEHAQDIVWAFNNGAFCLLEPLKEED